MDKTVVVQLAGIDEAIEKLEKVLRLKRYADLGFNDKLEVMKLASQNFTVGVSPDTTIQAYDKMLDAILISKEYRDQQAMPL